MHQHRTSAIRFIPEGSASETKLQFHAAAFVCVFATVQRDDGPGAADQAEAARSPGLGQVRNGEVVF